MSHYRALFARFADEASTCNGCGTDLDEKQTCDNHGGYNPRPVLYRNARPTPNSDVKIADELSARWLTLGHEEIPVRRVEPGLPLMFDEMLERICTFVELSHTHPGLYDSVLP